MMSDLPSPSLSRSSPRRRQLAPLVVWAWKPDHWLAPPVEISATGQSQIEPGLLEAWVCTKTSALPSPLKSPTRKSAGLVVKGLFGLAACSLKPLPVESSRLTCQPPELQKIAISDLPSPLKSPTR